MYLKKLSFDRGTRILSGISNDTNVVWNFIQEIKKLFSSISLSHLSQKPYVSFTIRLSYTR
nr:PilN domain-containing protein [Coxiella endosymbiont of Ornithodoros maritimus]